MFNDPARAGFAGAADYLKAGRQTNIAGRPALKALPECRLLAHRDGSPFHIWKIAFGAKRT
jgi:hypothetical protein